MDAHAWCARMLRNLRAIHASTNDVVRLAGAAERLRLVGAARPRASSPDEQAACAVQLASAIHVLRWEARRDEARQLLEEALATPSRAFAPDVVRQLEALLADEWFQV